MLRVQNLTKEYLTYEKAPGLAGSLRALFRRQYRTVTAVRDLSFQIEPGQIVGFLGPNGAGKTTTLKILAGLLYPTAGEVSVVGYRPQQREAAFLRSITMVMGQKQQLAWDISPADSFLVNKALFDIGDAEYRERLGELSDLLNLSPIIHKPVRKLSLGERMKCELAVALLHRPLILFLDEPTIGLDVNTQRAMRDFIRQYNQRTGATILLTSHYMADVAALADRVLVIDRGKLTFDGDLAQLTHAFAPEKILKVQTSAPLSREALEGYGRLRRVDGVKCEWLVPRQQTKEMAVRILTDLDVVDISIEDLPLDEVIGLLFRKETCVS